MKKNRKDQKEKTCTKEKKKVERIKEKETSIKEKEISTKEKMKLNDGKKNHGKYNLNR
jgi:hypothetical protein